MAIGLPFPVTMTGRIDRCVLLSYRVRAEAVSPLLPAGLEPVLLDRSDDRWAFLNVVVCRIDRMRPRGLPPALGMSYHHAACRVLVRCRVESGTDLQGLYFLRSDADSLPVRLGGNALTDFRFHKARIESRADGERFSATVRTPDRAADADLTIGPGEAALPRDTVFGSMGEARGLLKYRPLGLAVDETGRRVRLAEVFRDAAAWHERAVAVERAEFGYLDRFRGAGLALELCTRVAPIEYRWRLGRSLRLTGA